MPFLQGKSSSPSFPAPESPRKGTFGFSSKLSGPFWKSKSKHSVGSESQGSSSIVSGLGSPPFTPDSSLSIYTNSLDSDCSNSSTTSSSNQVSPSQNSVFTSGSNSKKAKKPSRLASLEDQISTYSYNNDCERYAANMFYDMGDACSFECRVPVEHHRRSRNSGGIPTTPSFEEDDCVHPYYNNSTFTTFPNPRRRHSITYSSYSSSLTSNGSSTKRGGEEMIELLPLPSSGLPGPDGYLVPISTNSETNSIRRNKKGLDSNSARNVYQNDSVTSAIVEVDVHVTDPSARATSSSKSTGNGSLSDCNSNGLSLTDSSSCSSSVTKLLNRSHQASSNDSDATIVPASDQQEGGGVKEKSLLYMSRILMATSDCEPFCSLCATSAVITSTKTSSMDVAIIYYHQCYFSRVINDKISQFFERMVTQDNQKIDIALQVYDLKDLDHQSVAAEVHRAKVQIVIISNPFLDWLRHEAASRKKLSPVNRVLRSKRVIAIITGTTAADISAGHQAALARFNEWFTLELPSASKVDGEFCKQFTDQVVKIYNVEQGSSGGSFSVFPKKVTREQPKIVIMLKKPLEADDAIRVEVAKGRDAETLKNVTPTNPYTAIIRIPDGLAGEKTSLFEITVYVNQRKLGTKLVKYEYQPKTAEDDVIQRMLKAVPGFQKLLDEHLSQKLAKHFRDSTDWALDPELEIMNDALLSRVENLPTLMHFSAYYGLEQTLWTVLDESDDGLEQCETRNEYNETPLDIAQGNTEQILKDYQELSASCKTFDLVKRLIDASEVNGGSAIANGMYADSGDIPSVSNDLSRSGSSTDMSGDAIDSSSLVTQEVRESAVNASASMYDVPPAIPSYGAKKTETATAAVSGEAPKAEAEKEIPPTPRMRKHTQPIRDHIDISYINIIKNREDSALKSENSVTTEPPPTPPPRNNNNDPLLNYDFPNPDAPAVIDCNYQFPPPARPVSPFHFDTTRRDDGYMPMLPMSPPAVGPSGSPQVLTNPSPQIIAQQNNGSEPTVSNQHDRKVPDIVLDYAEKELYDIMQDYKKNLLSMRQLEILFEHWKRRPHVKSSYEERKEKLKQMRDEYRHIQDQMKKTSRRPSVFEKVANLFARKKGVNGEHATVGSDLHLNSNSSVGSSATLNGNDGLSTSTLTESDFKNFVSSLRPAEKDLANSSVSNLPTVMEREKPSPAWREERQLVSGSYVVPCPGSKSVFPMSPSLDNSVAPALSSTSLPHYYNDVGKKPARKPAPPPPPHPETPPETPSSFSLGSSRSLENSFEAPSPPPRPAKKPPQNRVDYENEVVFSSGSLKFGKQKPPYVNTP